MGLKWESEIACCLCEADFKERSNQPKISPDCSFFELNEWIDTKERLVQPSTHPFGSFGNGANQFSSRNRLDFSS